MPWDPPMANLRNVLAGLFPDIASSQRVVDDAGLPSHHIAFDAAATNNWHNILNEEAG